MTPTIKLSELERAFELARSGEYSNTSQIRDQVRKEGFSGTQIEGASLRTQLNEICRKAGSALVVPHAGE